MQIQPIRLRSSASNSEVEKKSKSVVAPTVCVHRKNEDWGSIVELYLGTPDAIFRYELYHATWGDMKDTGTQIKNNGNEGSWGSGKG